MTKALLLTLFLLLAACTLPAGAGTGQPPVGSLQALATLTVGGAHQCGGVFIHPHVVLTAEHCLKDGPVAVNGLPAVLVALDGNDHALLRTEARAPAVALVNRHGEPAEGSRVHMWGKPGGVVQLLLRQGRVAAVGFELNGKPSTLYEMQAWHGDSGSPIFNRWGRVEASLTGGVQIGMLMFSVSLPYAFTDAQWALR